MLNWNRFKSKLLLRYMISYLLIFLIPLIVVTATIYNSSVNSLRDQIEQSNLNQLTLAKASIDELMTQLNETAAIIAYDEQLASYMVKDPYYSRNAVQALERYKLNNAALEDIFLYLHGDDVIYSSRGLTDLNILLQDTYQFEQWTPEEALIELNELKAPLVRPAERVQLNQRQQTMVTYIVPIVPNSPTPYGSVMFLLDEAKLTSIMDPILNGYSTNSFIFDSNGQAITSTHSDDKLSNSDIKALSSLEPGIHSINLNHERYSVVSVQSEVSSWKYIIAMPSVQLYSNIVQVQTWIILIFTIVVLIGIPVAIQVARRQYHPFQDLMDMTAKHQPYVRNQCLLLLLKHGKPCDKQTEQLIQSVGLNLHAEQYFVMLLELNELSEPEKDNCLDRREIAEMLYRIPIIEQHAHGYGAELTQTHQIVIIVSLQDVDEASKQSMMEQSVEKIRQFIIEQTHHVPSIGVGTCYPKLEAINESYIEAATALEYKITCGIGSVTYFERMTPAAPESFWLPKNMLLKLVQSLKQGNETVAQHMIESIILSMHTQPLSPALLRCICFDLINTLLKTASELDMNEIVKDIPHLTSFQSLEELQAKSNDLASQICKQVEQKNECKQHSLMDDILAYIDDHFTDYTLNLEHIAMEFSISTSSLSRSFKEHTGMNFSQYVWNLRVKEAKRLLLTTNVPLKEIILQVGYLDTPNFIRKFKKETGYTPGQYRKENSAMQNQLITHE